MRYVPLHWLYTSTLPIVFSCFLVPFALCEPELRPSAPVLPVAGCHNSFDPAAEHLLGVVLDELIATNIDLSTSADLNLHLGRVIERLSATLDTPHVPFLGYVFKSSELNATGSPSGHLYLSDALTSTIMSDDELAFVVAHEMSHVLLHHPGLVATADLRASLNVERPASREQLDKLYRAMFRSGGPDPSPTRYQCISEAAADATAVKLMEAAGYRASASVDLWARLASRSPVGRGILADDRLENLRLLTFSKPFQKEGFGRLGMLRGVARFITLTSLRAR